LSPAAAGKVRAFYELVEGWRRLVGAVSLTALAERVLEESGYLAELHAERSVEAEARIENLKEFLSVTRQFELEQGQDLGAFLEHVALVSDVDVYDPQADSVVMMTLHAAKGLEFPVVFLVGMEEGVFPHSRAVSGTRGAGRGAPPLLRRDDPGQGAAVSHLRPAADAVRRAGGVGGVPLCGRDPGAPG